MRAMSDLALAALAGVIAMHAASALMPVAVPAPAPLKGPPPPPAIVAGGFTMSWAGTPCETHFHQDGHYACRWRGEWWEGRWSQAGGVLRVTEWPLDQPGRPGVWDVTLSCPRSGRMGASAWRLVPLQGKVR